MGMIPGSLLPPGSVARTFPRTIKGPSTRFNCAVTRAGGFVGGCQPTEHTRSFEARPAAARPVLAATYPPRDGPTPAGLPPPWVLWGLMDVSSTL